jgi:hypothetical protein
MQVAAPTVPVIEVENEGLIGLLNQRVTLFCMNYIYTGKLVGVNDKFVKIEDAAIVYETGAFDEKNWKDAQKLPNSLYVTTSSIESFTILK